MVKGIEDLFPGLRGTSYQIIAPPDPIYNCIAWAAGVTDCWWWPIGDPAVVHWPTGVAHEGQALFVPPKRHLFFRYFFFRYFLDNP
jgi:hypothetical protein